MGASSDKIHIAVTAVTVVGAKITHLQYEMTNAAKNGSLCDMIFLFPGFGHQADFKFDVCIKVCQSLFF